MTATSKTATSNVHSSIHYPEKTIFRAEQAMRCAPFRPDLYRTMAQKSVSLQAIAMTNGVQNHYTDEPLSELRVESELLWLLQVGLLRREVDGQGLTDSFRVTPLGRQFVNQWQNQQGAVLAESTWRDRLSNGRRRWVRLPF